MILSFLLLFAAAVAVTSPAPTAPFRREELLFPPQSLHNHGSCLVETPKGDLLACWYRGSGERRADDVAVMGARLKKDSLAWSEPFVMADTPGFPDTNPCMIIDPQKRLWLLWNTILDNRWESALLKCKISKDYDRAPGPPRWQTETVIHIKPGEEFVRVMQRDLDRAWEGALQAAKPEDQEKIKTYLADRHKMAEVPLNIRLGWMTRAHPTILNEKRLIIPLYSDGFDFSLMALSDDWGATWKFSEPLVGQGNVQPSIARRKDGTLVAYFRDNGPPPNRVITSESRDDGLTWTPPRDLELLDTGAGLEILVLKSGRWVLVNNDVESGRYSLALTVSEDEGRTWAFKRHLERDTPGPDAGSYSYPSILQARDGTIHATYSYRPDKARAAQQGQGESIKHVQFNEAWLLEGRDGK